MTASPQPATRPAAAQASEPSEDDSGALGGVIVPAVRDLAAEDPNSQWLEERRGYLVPALPRHVDERQFMVAALKCLSGLPQPCTNESLTLALMTCAELGLDPDGREAAIIAYKDQATFVPMYQGFIKLMYESGAKSVVFDTVHEGDTCTLDNAKPAPDDFTHQRPLVDSQRGPQIAAYAFAWLEGGLRSQVAVVDRAKAEDVRDKYSKSYQTAEKHRRDDPKKFAKARWGDAWFYSPWHTSFDDMWMKTAVRRLAKRLPKSPRLRRLLDLDDEFDNALDDAADDTARRQEQERARAYVQAHAEPEDAPEDACTSTGAGTGHAHQDVHARTGVHTPASGGDVQDADVVHDDAAGVYTGGQGMHEGAHPAVQEQTQRALLLAEVAEIEKIVGRAPGEMAAALEGLVGAGLDEAPVAALLGVIGPFRANVVEALHTAGRAEEAMRYAEAGQELIAPVHELFGWPPPVAEDAAPGGRAHGPGPEGGVHDHVWL